MSADLPIRALPPGSCDCHSHIYPPREAFPVGSGQFEAGADVEDYLAVCRRLGLSRHVIVQGKAYPDPASLLAVLSRLGPPTSRGIVFLDPATPDGRLEAWHDSGVRGVRLLFRKDEAVDIGRIDVTAQRVAGLGWHLIVQAEGDALVAHYPRLAALPVPVVIDHIGRLPRGGTKDDPAARALLDFLAGGGWIKLAAPYNLTRDGRSDFSSLAAIVTELVAAAPARCIWGLNFPHPNLPADDKPDEAATLASLLRLLTEEEIARIFVENPASLYGFPTPQV
ncbi:hypothetical protein ASE63_20040 [Bosea sp. Root381]|uniref:amidohydrolase family protein n=1 Tax=Bosea sp. Root381 TaxID=1736524 RepID=UPI0006F8433A|nr:amidohydrolase family protein [Bosea sp. Root381]KRE12013.1 hypothetical protein ASE63_20040 [Bosea sp. Root381]